MGALVPDAHKVEDRCSRETPRIANGGAGELGVGAPDGARPAAHVCGVCPFPASAREADGSLSRAVYTKRLHAPCARAVRRARGWWSPPGLDEARAVMEDSSCLSEASSPVISLGVALT